MDIEQHEQKFDQSLEQLSHSTTRLTNTLVCYVTERSPQLYLKTKPYLFSCIGSLSQAVVKVQQARNKLSFFRQKVGLASAEELASPLLAKGQREKKREQESAFVGRSLRQTRTQEELRPSDLLESFGRGESRSSPPHTAPTDTR